MATKKMTLRYGLAAVLIAMAVIGSSLYFSPAPVSGQTNFVVMLTDPPTVPDGTTKLEVMYSSIQLHVKYADGTANWVASQESGTVDLLSLVNVEQTIASVSLHTGDIVDKIQFTISAAKATINDKVVDVKTLSNQLIVNIKDAKLTGTTAGALIDLRPKLLEIKAVDSNGAPISYYVLVPSATAVAKTSVEESHRNVGAKNKLSDDDNNELEEEYQQASHDLSITGATVKVEGDKTTITVTIKNTGTQNITIHGLTVTGDFTFTNPQGQSSHEDNDHPRAIPFQLSGNTLTPRMGDDDGEHGVNGGLELKPGDTATLTYSGTIQIRTDHEKASPLTITPITGGKYTIRVEGEGSQTLEVTAS